MLRATRRLAGTLAKSARGPDGALRLDCSHDAAIGIYVRTLLSCERARAHPPRSPFFPISQLLHIATDRRCGPPTTATAQAALRLTAALRLCCNGKRTCGITAFCHQLAVPVPLSVSHAGRGTRRGPSFATAQTQRCALGSASFRVLLPLFRVSLYELSPRLQLVSISNRLTSRGSGFRDFGHKAERL